MGILDKNSLPLGLVLGFLSPIIGLGLIYILFGLMTQLGIMDEAGSVMDKRIRTMAILAICTNIFWIKKMNQTFTAQTLRGIIIATMILCGIWFFQYYETLYSE